MDTYSRIKDIFNSGTHAFRVNQESIQDIAFLVDEEYLKLEEIEIGTKEQYHRLLNQSSPDLDDTYKASGGGDGHVALKQIIGMYLRKNGYEVHYERTLCGYVADVITSDKSIVAECGHTQNSEKMLAYFKQGHIKEFIQIPYPDEDSLTISGYIFTAGNDLEEFLLFLDNERRSEARKAFQRK